MPLILDTPPSEKQSLLSDPLEERRKEQHAADVVIVGAGILGCALATTLARQGRSVILLEKSLATPDRIVGELLQPGGYAALQKLGLSDCLEDIDAIKVDGYEIFYFGDPVLIPYPEDGRGTNDGKQPQGRSFHHGRFVQRLRDAASREPNVSIIESTAVSLIRSDGNNQVLGVECKTAGAKDFYFADLTVVCDGYASTFRNHDPIAPPNSKRAPISKSKFYALELQDCQLPAPLHGHVILGSSAPVLLYQIGTHETRALIDIPTNTPTASVANGGVKGHIRNVVLPELPESVKPSFDAALKRAEAPTKSADGKSTGPPLRSMPNSFLAPITNTTPGLCLLGDALNMRHPLTGGGMTVALNDVQLLSTLLDPTVVPNFQDTHAVLAALKTFHWRRKHLSSVINILAQALYALFAANDTQLRALQNGCMRYFARGGECIAGPCGLLAGLTRRPWVLVYHFFAVAVLGMWIYVVEGLPAAARGPAPSAGAGATPPPEKLVRTADRSDAPRVSPRPRAEQKSQLDLLGAPVRLLLAPGVLYKACVVIFPYIFAELRP